MNKLGQYTVALSAVALCQASGLACAQQILSGLNLTLKPRLLDSRIVDHSNDKSREAQLNSGLGVRLASRVLAVDVDYGMLGVVNEHSTKSKKLFSQKLDARLQSSLLNETLGVDAVVTAESMFRDGGQIYRGKVSPGFSAALTRQSRLSVNYDYVLDKPSRLSAARESRGYSLMLEGSLHNGRLAWSTQYRANSEYKDRLLLTRAIEGLALKSSYQLGATLQIEVSSAFSQEFRVVGNGEALSAESRYGAALRWSPTDQYSLGFTLHSRDHTDQQRWQTSGSGTLRWLPHRDLQFTLDYGDQLIQGSAGWMLHTRLDISG